MTPKFKAKQPAGGRLLGVLVDGEPWVTNGHWAAKSDLVAGLTSEQISAFAVGSGWDQRPRGNFAKGNGVTIDAVLKTDGLDLIECALSPLSIGDKKTRYGFTVDSNGVLQTYSGDYLTPLEGLQLKSVKGKNTGVYAYDQEKIVARVQPVQMNGPISKQLVEAIERFRSTTFPLWER